MRASIPAALVLFALISMTVAENDDRYLLSREENNLTFNVDQKISGSGFFSAYRYALMPYAKGPEGRLYNGVEAKNLAHASGTQDTESLFFGERTYVKENNLNPKIKKKDLNLTGESVKNIKEEKTHASSVIDLKEDNTIIYGVTTLSVGLRYYGSHPLAFNSLIKEDVWIKNRDGLISLDHEVKDAHALSKLMHANLYTHSEIANLSLNVEEDLTEGKSHFGALQLVDYPKNPDDEEEDAAPGTAMKLWQKPSVELDEDYIGSFHMKKNMTLTLWEDDEKWAYAWLPCCSGGFLSMNPMDRVDRSVSGIFDCTCYKVPTKAQFQRI